MQANPYRSGRGVADARPVPGGRPADALAAYGRARVVLAAELGIEPGPALREMEQAILTHDHQLRADGVGSGGLGRSNLPAALNPIVGRELRARRAGPARVRTTGW